MSVIAVVTLGALMVLTGVVDSGGASQDACSQASRISGECPSITTSVDSSGVTVGATQTTQGTAGRSTGPSMEPNRNSWSPPPVRNPVLGSPQCTIIIAGSCRGQSPPKNPPSPVVVAGPSAPKSVSDLASFAPQAPGIVVEPGGWSLPRVGTNIYSTARAHLQVGELLGWPIEVRFSPQIFRWNYGDGARASHAVSGGTWGPAQFSLTPTSHTYRAPGTYGITLEVDYAVAYRFGDGPFVPLSGTVRAGFGPSAVRVLRVTPLLVDSGCSGLPLREGRCEGN